MLSMDKPLITRKIRAKLEKVFAIGLAMTTLVWLSGFAVALAPQVANAASLPDGTLIRGPDGIKVYVVNAEGYKRHIFNPAVFNMYQNLSWNNIQSVDQATLDSYTTSDLYRVAGTAPVYSVTENADGTATKHWLNMTASDFVSCGYNWNQVFTVNQQEANYYPTGSDLTSTNCSSTTTPTTPTAQAGLTVTAAAPSSTAVVAGQAAAALGSYTFANGDSSTDTVTQVVLTRTGLSADTSLDNVYLYNGNTRITDAANVSNGTVTFSNTSGLFTVAPNSSTTITVKADVDAAAGGQSVGVELASATAVTSNATAVNGTFPLASGVVSIATGTLATVAVGANNSVAASNVNAGTTNYTFWGDTLTVGQRPVKLSYVRFQEIGSVATTDIQSLGLYVNGTQVGSTANVGTDGSVVFDLSSSPVTLNTGASTLTLQGNIIGGSNRSVSFSIENAADLQVVDSNYNVAVLPTGIPAASGLQTINAGQVVVNLDPSFNGTTITGGTSNTEIAQYTFTAYGEAMKISSLNVNFTANGINGNGKLANVHLTVNGGQIGTTQNWTGAALTFQLGSSLVIPAGTTDTIGVYADTIDTAGTDITAGTLQATLSGAANNAQGQSSLALATVPTAGIAGNTMTVSTAAVSISTNTSFVAQNILAQTQKQLIGSYVISAGAAEGVKLTGMTVGVVVDGTNMTLNDVTNLTTDQTGTQTYGTPTATNNFPISTTIAANSSLTVNVYANIGAAAATGTIHTSLALTGLGATSNTAINVAAVNGPTLTVAAGSLTNPPTLDVTALPSQFVLGGNSVSNAAVYNFVSNVGTSTITEMKFMVAGGQTASPATSFNSGVSPIQSVTVGGVTVPVVSDGNGNLVADVTGLNITIPVQNGGQTVTVTPNLNTVGTNGVTSGAKFNLDLLYVKYMVGSSVDTMGSLTVGNNALTVLSNPLKAVASDPTVSLASGGNSLTPGSNVIATVTVTANAAGNVTVTQLPLTINTNGATVAADTLVVKNTSTGATTTATNAAINPGTAFTGNIDVSAIGSVPAGTTVTFAVIAGNVTESGTGNSIVTAIVNTTPAAFLWNDVKGGGANLTGSYILNYPTNAVSVSN